MSQAHAHDGFTSGTTVAEIRAMLNAASAEEFDAIERSLAADTRKGVKSAIETARRRLAAQEAERERLRGLFAFDRSKLPPDSRGYVVGLDEVGRGAVAGPLAVGAVAFPEGAFIEGLNDSKQLTPEQRETVSAQVKREAVAWAVAYVEPGDIDRDGMSASLRKAFASALADVEDQLREGAGGRGHDAEPGRDAQAVRQQSGQDSEAAQGAAVEGAPCENDAETGRAAGSEQDAGVVVVLVDGNPLGIDAREVNVVKGDAKSASIAAASVVAKVERDQLMRSLSSTFPQYGFSSNKGYASEQHVEAIRENGLSPVHRASFCKSFLQETLF